MIQQATYQHIPAIRTLMQSVPGFTSLLHIYRRTEKLWRKTVSRRSQDGEVVWEQCQKLTQSFPLVRPPLSITSAELQASATL